MPVTHDEIPLTSRGHHHVHDITDEVQVCVSRRGILDGVATVFCPGATGGVTTIEFESGCVQDLERLFDEIVPVDVSYAHNERWGDGNGHSHVRAALLGPSLGVPIVSGRLRLGTWQQIIFVDFDNRSRDRRLHVTLMGE
jgi:secondary thiamine-phosphate synthase enzyme